MLDGWVSVDAAIEANDIFSRGPKFHFIVQGFFEEDEEGGREGVIRITNWEYYNFLKVSL